MKTKARILVGAVIATGTASFVTVQKTTRRSIVSSEHQCFPASEVTKVAPSRYDPLVADQNGTYASFHAVRAHGR